MPSPRTRLPTAPSAVRNAPLDALRSHAVPIYPERFLPAAQEMGRGPAPRSFLPISVVMQGNVKDAHGRYMTPDATLHSYAAVVTSPSAVLTQRLVAPQSPMQPMAELAQAFQDELWTQLNWIEPQGPVPYDRAIPMHGRLPAVSFEELEQYEGWVATRQQAVRHERRMDAMRQIADGDAMIARLMGMEW